MRRPRGHGSSTRTGEGDRSARGPLVGDPLEAHASEASGVDRARGGTVWRDAPLDAVIRIVAEVGADAVTHRRVAEMADLPLASTTYWFDSKEHLLTAALERATDRDIARGEALLEAWPEGEPLDLAVDAVLEPLDETGQASRGSLVATSALLLEGRAPSRAARHNEALDGLLRRGAQSAAGPRRLSGSPSDAALLLAAADGLLVEQLASGEYSDIDLRLRRLAAVLVKP